MRRDDTGSGLACRAALPPRGGKGGEEREDGRDSGTETRGSRRGRAVRGTGRRRAAENGGGRREKRNIGGIQEKKGCRERESLQLLFGFLSFIISLAGTWRNVTGMRWICFTVANSFNIL